MIKRVYQVMLGYIATIVFSYCTFYYWNFIDIDNWLHRSSLCHNPPFSEELRKYWFSFFCVVLSHLAVCLYRSIRLDWTKIALTDICTVAFLGIESISVGLAYISPFQTTCVDFLGVESSPFIWLSWVSCVPILFMLANLGFKSEDSAIECILLSGTAMTLLAFQNISLPYIPIVSALVSTHWLSFAISSVTFSLAIVRLQQAMRLKLQKAQLAFDAINESKRDDLTNQAVVYDLKSSQAGCKVANRLSFMLCLFPGLYFLRAGRIFSVETYTMVILITSTMTKVFFATMVNDAQSAALDPRLRGLMEEKKRIETHRNALLRYIFHEVRTPLNSLVLGLQCLADLKVTTSTEQEVLEMMAVGTEQINKTLNDVISFQIIDEGSLVLDFTWFEPSAFLKMLHKNFQ